MSHYYTEQVSTKSNPHLIEFSFAGQDYTFWTDHGVFSKGHIDQGSEILLRAWQQYLSEEAPLELRKELQVAQAVDLGCGYGVLGIVLQSLYPKQTWSFVDINERAVALCQKNLQENNLAPNQVFQASGLAPFRADSLALIVSNPPIRIGKTALYTLYEEAYEKLQLGGHFVLVVGKKQGAKSTKQYLASLFPELTSLNKKKGFEVFLCVKS